MSVSRIASRYAKSLIDFAQENNKLEEVRTDMALLDKALESRDLVMLLKSPIVNELKKKEIFNVLFDGKLSDTTLGFLNIIMNKGREEYIPAISNEFEAQYKLMKGISEVKLTTATPISEANLSSIKAKLLSSNETSQEVEIDTIVDPSILGGFIIEIGDKLYNDSIAYKLSQMKKGFKGNLHESAM
ncbi:MAG: ATP synthase F1 subunit delta [Saprospiraceae bacterium]|jgi:F-type H+-transporting ATPase subunit delta|nr:ATP synthase F1 subunit delta [Saprospiraceae bacterium]